MSVKKDVEVIYVAPIPKERSGIGMDVPAHVKIQWFDDQGHRNACELMLSPWIIQKIAELPNKE